MIQYILIIGKVLTFFKHIDQELRNFNNTTVFYANSCQKAMDYVSRFNCSLAIMDFDGLEFGIEFIKKLHLLHSGTLLVLSDHATEYEEIQVLEAGADQYLEIGTPLALKRCLANVSAIIRRNSLHDSGDALVILNAGIDLKINRRLRKAFAHGQDLHLTPKQFALLNSLVDHVGEVVTKEHLYQEVWENEYDISADSALKYHIKELRRKLDEHGVRGIIETAWGMGYLLQIYPDE